MSKWKVIKPMGATNLLLNSKFDLFTAGTPDNFDSWSEQKGTAGSVQASTDNVTHGVYSCRIQWPSGTTAYISQQIAVESATSYVLSFDYTLADGAFKYYITGDISGSGGVLASTLVTAAGSGRIEVAATTGASDTAAVLYISIDSGYGAVDVYIDAVNICPGSTPTTYIDGDEDGCYWQGERYLSPSTRLANSPYGGQVLDLEDDLNFGVEQMSDMGVPPVNVNLHALALMQGASYVGRSELAAQIKLAGTLTAQSLSELHQIRQALVKQFLSQINKINEPPTGVLMRYTGATVEKEVLAVYDAGLELKHSPKSHGFAEETALRLITPDPFWREVGSSGAVLDYEDQALVEVVSRKIGGVWNQMEAPSTSGTYLWAFSLEMTNDGKLIIAGDFQNYDNIAEADYIVQYDTQTGTYSAMGTGMAGGLCDNLIKGPDGSIYATGQFTSAGGVANTLKIAKWNGSAWSALGTGLNSTGGEMAFDSSGNLYVVGAFTAAGGVTAYRIAKWNGSTWSAVGLGFGATASAVRVDADGNIWAGGSFTTLSDASSCNYLAMYDGSTWTEVGGLNGPVYSICFDKAGNLYAGGNFTTGDGVTLNGVGMWNGTSWSALAEGNQAGGYANNIHVAPDGMVWVGGNAINIPGLEPMDDMARWNGSAWIPNDEDWRGTGNEMHDILFHNEDTYIAHRHASTTSMFAGYTTITYTGTAPAYPIIDIEWSATSGGTVRIENIVNVTTGAMLSFAYNLILNERLTIDLRPGKPTCVSSFYGEVPSAILPSSNTAQFNLVPGPDSAGYDNVIQLFVNRSASQTVNATMRWKTAYLGVD